jgi:hypothetical protein
MKSEALEVTEAYSAARATHPRVTLDSMKAKFANVHFLNAGAALAAVGQPLPEGSALMLMTLCFIAMDNGFVVLGQSTPASAENFDEEKGRTFAYENAVRQLWPLEGYLLREVLHQASRGEVPAPAFDPGPSVLDAAPAPLPSVLFEIPPSKTDMVAYVGTKGVYAKPMTRGEYLELRSWPLPPNESADDAGYLLEYADGGKPNVDGFAGYVSWTPADVFDRAYHADGEP